MSPRTIVIVGTLAFAVGAAVLMPMQFLALLALPVFLVLALAAGGTFRQRSPPTRRGRASLAASNASKS